ncbi:MAG: aconitate hydratase, partial [Cyanobacteria bacterium NC_groundwater_1444_Ag_S-0.65um_54_12]|nr:aconitate hydratase [Cyanobacteria bacterium NC_groundwater_1444_Ag_S-0.65um_54_12]
MEEFSAALQSFEPTSGRIAKFYSLAFLEQAGFGHISRLPICLRVILESLLRNLDGKRVRAEDVRRLAAWEPKGTRNAEVPFVVARVLLQDFTGVPLLVDLAAMRSAAARLGRDPQKIEPMVPVDLVIDHSVQVDYYGRSDALSRNLEKEFQRNSARYQFLKWGGQAFDNFRIIPPGIGICHQVNLEYLAKGVIERAGSYYPDTLVGTDSHTTMINGLGIVGWGVGGIEAEAAMLGQPIYFLMPDVVGVHLKGALPPGATATDLVLAITELLRRAKVVGKFVEYYGEGAAALTTAERSTVANMAPEYGATLGFFPPDEETCSYLLGTGRFAEAVEALKNYYRAQGMFGIPRAGAIDYSEVWELELADIEPSVAGPKRPQDRIALRELKTRFAALLTAAPPAGYGKSGETLAKRFALHDMKPARSAEVVLGGGAQSSESVPSGTHPLSSPQNTAVLTEREMIDNRPTPDRLAVAAAELTGQHLAVGHGDVLIAAITSCTNTSNPSVMLGAGLLAKKAVMHGLSVHPTVKTSLAPGSRVVTEYLRRTGLQDYLDQLGFHTVGYGCTTCIGNSGPLDPCLEALLAEHDLIGVAVLSGNRNFEARIHQSLKANFLMSPPLVVAFALAGRIASDFDREPLGKGKAGEEIFLRDIWPTPVEIRQLLEQAMEPAVYRKLYGDATGQPPLWLEIANPSGKLYDWDPAATYIQEPPYFVDFAWDPSPPQEIRGARMLAWFGDSLTTDHISPAGAIRPATPAGNYLSKCGVLEEDFNSYGARRGNHEVMVRGTFANVRIKNRLLEGSEGGVTIHQPAGDRMSIHDAAMA